MRKLLLIIVNLAIIAFNTASPPFSLYRSLDNFLNGSKKELFKSYHFVYEKEKEYSLYSEEGIRKYNIFKNNIKRINEENAKNHSYKLGLGPFTDMTTEEFEEKMLMKSEEFEGEQFNKKSLNIETLPSYEPINWLEHFNEPRSQGYLGVCGKFAAATATEANFHLLTGKRVLLSVQQIVDCGEDKAVEYMAKDGISQEVEYPYVGKYAFCRYKQNGLRLASGIESCPNDNCPFEKWLGLLRRGPIQAVIDASGFSKQHYSNGVYEPTSETCKQVNHGVVVYGIDHDDKGDYLIGRNSWGKGWGINGDYKMRIHFPTYTCMLTRKGNLPIVRDVDVPAATPPPAKDCPTFYKTCNYKKMKNLSCDGNNSNSDTIASVKVGEAKEVILFSGKDCLGERMAVTKDNECLTNIFPKTGSFAVHYSGEEPSDGCIWLLSNTCHNGHYTQICNDIEDTGEELKTYSIRLGKGVRGVKLFSSSSFKGKSVDITQDVGNMGDPAFNNFGIKLKSIKITK